MPVLELSTHLAANELSTINRAYNIMNTVSASLPFVVFHIFHIFQIFRIFHVLRVFHFFTFFMVFNKSCENENQYAILKSSLLVTRSPPISLHYLHSCYTQRREGPA